MHAVTSLYVEGFLQVAAVPDHCAGAGLVTVFLGMELCPHCSVAGSSMQERAHWVGAGKRAPRLHTGWGAVGGPLEPGQGGGGGSGDNRTRWCRKHVHARASACTGTEDLPLALLGSTMSPQLWPRLSAGEAHLSLEGLARWRLC